MASLVHEMSKQFAKGQYTIHRERQTSMSGRNPVHSVSPSSTCQPDGMSTDTTAGTPSSFGFWPSGTTNLCRRESKGGRGMPVQAFEKTKMIR